MNNRSLDEQTQYRKPIVHLKNSKRRKKDLKEFTAKDRLKGRLKYTRKNKKEVSGGTSASTSASTTAR